MKRTRKYATVRKDRLSGEVMNRSKKLRQMRRFILKHGIIDEEGERPPEKNFRPYRKGSYYANYLSDELGLTAAVGDSNKYEVYKSLRDIVKQYIKE